MAQQFISSNGALTVPGAYPTITVQSGASGLSTNGVIALVGEADAGPDYTLETDLNANSFGPDALAAILSKYKSGPLVDAFRGASVPANDPDIVNAPSKFVLVKTNPSVKATTTLLNNAAGTYATLQDQSYGALGNMIYYSVAAKTSEVKPTTGAFTFLVPIGAFDMSIRLNGGSEILYTASAAQLPSAFQSGLQGASASLSVTGGADRSVITSVAGTLAAAASGNSVVFTISTSWANQPLVGDTLFISTTSVVKGGSSQNCGSYVVTAATASTITATKLMDATGSPGALTTPVTVSAVSIASTTADLRAFAPITIAASSTALIDGLGKTIEINELTTNTDRLSNCAYSLNTSKVTWVSKTGAATDLVSATEQSVTLNVNRQVDNTTESMSAGGIIALQLGYTGVAATCSVTVTATTLSTVVTGGTGANLSLALASFPTLNDLVAYINTQTGYTASVGTAAAGQFLSTQLDEGTFTAGSTFGNPTMRLKVDAVKFFQAVTNTSATVALVFPTVGNVAGLPAVTTGNKFLAGGARGGTSNNIFTASIDALQAVNVNFIVPLFSQNATLDAVATVNPTDPSSTYTIDTINAYIRTHVNAMSTLKRKKNRQGFCSKRDTFLNVQTAAQNLAAARVSLCFQDVKDIGANGLTQFQPYMAAAKAAGMQAAGFYKAIVNKQINISGAVQGAVVPSDYTASLDSNQETALLSGLLPIAPKQTGGFAWVSDQTTYLRDNNFVFNSIQAMYVADTIALTTAQRMQNAFVGQSVADVSASVAMAALAGIMADMLRLKLIAVSDDAPNGYKNARITISGPTMNVTVEIKLAGAIYFIPINFQVTQVTQSVSF
jgi:hypothetical protein